MCSSFKKQKMTSILQSIEKINTSPLQNWDFKYRLPTNRFYYVHLSLISCDWLPILTTHLRTSLLQSLQLLQSVIIEPMLRQWWLLRPVQETPAVDLLHYSNGYSEYDLMSAMCWRWGHPVLQNTFLLFKQFKSATNCLSKTKCHMCVMAVVDNSCQSNASIAAWCT